MVAEEATSEGEGEALEILRRARKRRRREANANANAGAAQPCPDELYGLCDYSELFCAGERRHGGGYSDFLY